MMAAATKVEWKQCARGGQRVAGTRARAVSLERAQESSSRGQNKKAVSFPFAPV